MLLRQELKESTPWRFGQSKVLEFNTSWFQYYDIFKDLDTKRPGLSDAVRLFFRVYKVNSCV